ncbi:MAG: hypothetical protein QW478_08855 [Candidatus Micrarchaeaceae archaeon]
MKTYEMKLDLDSIQLNTNSTNAIIRELAARAMATKTICNRKDEKWHTSIYKTNHGWHVYITAYTHHKPPTSKSIVVMQMMMMSDPFREILNIARINKHISNWNELFTSKYELKTHWWSHNRYLKKVSHEKICKQTWL